MNPTSEKKTIFPTLTLPLACGLVAALLIWAFILIGSEMLEGDTRSFDMQLLRTAQSVRAAQPWVAVAMRDFSGMGSGAVLTLFTGVTVVYLVLMRKHWMALLVASAVITGSVVVSWLKFGFARARPGVEFAELVASGLSFPSAHAGNSAIVFLTLGALLASTRIRAVERIYILSVATLMTTLVGLSRVALGVHWATDVLAGWAFGAAWALVWLMLARRVSSPKHYEQLTSAMSGSGSGSGSENPHHAPRPRPP